MTADLELFLRTPPLPDPRPPVARLTSAEVLAEWASLTGSYRRLPPVDRARYDALGARLDAILGRGKRRARG